MGVFHDMNSTLVIGVDLKSNPVKDERLEKLGHVQHVMKKKSISNC